jgi:hypothetical protein
MAVSQFSVVRTCVLTDTVEYQEIRLKIPPENGGRIEYESMADKQFLTSLKTMAG